MTRLEGAPSGIEAAPGRVMTRILSRFHRFLCPPPAGEASGETHFVQQASRYPAYRALAKASAPSDRTAAMRRTAPLSGFPTFCSQPRHRREARLSIHPAPFRRTCPEPMRDVRSSIPGDPPAEQPAPASAPAEGGDAGGIRATCRDAVAFEAEIHLSAAPGCQPGLSGPRIGTFEGDPSIPPRSMRKRSSPVSLRVLSAPRRVICARSLRRV